MSIKETCSQRMPRSSHRIRLIMLGGIYISIALFLIRVWIPLYRSSREQTPITSFKTVVSNFNFTDAKIETGKVDENPVNATSSSAGSLDKTIEKLESLIVKDNQNNNFNVTDKKITQTLNAGDYEVSDGNEKDTNTTNTDEKANNSLF